MWILFIHFNWFGIYVYFCTFKMIFKDEINALIKDSIPNLELPKKTSIPSKQSQNLLIPEFKGKILNENNKLKLIKLIIFKHHKLVKIFQLQFVYHRIIKIQTIFIWTKERVGQIKNSRSWQEPALKCQREFLQRY